MTSPYKYNAAPVRRSGIPHALFFVVLILSACGTKDATTDGDVPVVKIFEPGVISTAAPEFAMSFLPDGSEAFLNALNPDRSGLRIVHARIVNGSWTRIESVPFAAEGSVDVDPFVTPDGLRLYFSSNRLTSATDTTDDFNTWYVERIGDGWSEPVNPGEPLNGPGSDVFVSSTTDGVVYFSREADGVRRVFRSAWREGGYSEPEVVAINVPDSAGVGNPLIWPDESRLVFASNELEGIGGADLYVVHRTESGAWSDPVLLPEPINSAYADFAPALSPDREYLYFTSERPGIAGPVDSGRPPGDIYRVRVADVRALD